MSQHTCSHRTGELKSTLHNHLQQTTGNDRKSGQEVTTKTWIFTERKQRWTDQGFLDRQMEIDPPAHKAPENAWMEPAGQHNKEGSDTQPQMENCI